MIHKGRYESLTGKGLLFMIVISLYYGITSVDVDNWAHIGGLAMGFVLAIILYRKPRKAVDLSGENPYTMVVSKQREYTDENQRVLWRPGTFG